jgi:hypothetical protein
MLLAETILMAAGLVEPPTATHVRAARGLQADLRRDLVDILDREDPGRLYVCPERAGYFDRLSNPPVYESWSAVVERMAGTETADAYNVLHGNARRVLLDLRPGASIDTVLGPKPMPLDSISLGRWAIEVDVVEGMRLLKDLAAGALLKEEVDVFSACFPETYDYLLGELDLLLAKKWPAGSQVAPPLWLGDALRVLEQKPFGVSLELKPVKAPDAPPPAPKRGKGDLDTEALKTRSQQT